MTPSEIDTFKTDLAFDTDFDLTAAGDLDTISGLSNLKEALYRRIFTTPGSVVYRPDYGVGLKSYLNGINSLANQQQLLVALQTELTKDPRVNSITGLSVDSDDTAPGQVIITVSVQPIGYVDFQLVVNSGDI